MPRTQSFFNVSAGIAALQVVPYNEKRAGLLIKNFAGNPAFLSNDQVDVTVRGYPLAVGEFLSMVRVDGDVPELQLYAQTLVGAADLRIVETFGEV